MPVKRPFLWYVLGVVVPCALAMMVAGKSANDAWGGLRHTSQAHVGRMALAALEQDLGDAVTRLAAEAQPFPEADPSVPAIQRAMAGDTVAGLTRSGRSAELAVMLGAPQQDSASPAVLYAVTTLEPRAADVVARSTGYVVSFYINGNLWGDGDAPAAIPEETLRSLSRAPGGLAMTDAEGVLMASGPQPGISPSLVALVRPGSTPPRAVEIRILLVLGLLILFSILAGWIQLTRPPQAGTRRPGLMSLVTLAMVPALTAALFLVHLARTFDEAAADATVRDLTRGLAVAGALDVASSPDVVRQITGFHATLVQSGEVLESSFAGDATPIAALPSPPPSFTTSGTVSTPEGPSFYLALRRRGGAVIVATAPLPAARMAEAQGAFVRAGLGLLLWLLVCGAALGLFGRSTRPPATPA